MTLSTYSVHQFFRIHPISYFYYERGIITGRSRIGLPVSKPLTRKRNSLPMLSKQLYIMVHKPIDPVENLVFNSFAIKIVDFKWRT